MSSSSLHDSENKSNFEGEKGITYPKTNAIVGSSSDIGYLSEINDGSYTEEDLEIISMHLDDRSIDECRVIISDAVKLHHGDTCLPLNCHYNWEKLLEGPSETQSVEAWEIAMKFEAFILYEWSPYSAVRAVTRPIDEEEYENYENIRVYLVSTLWSCAGSVLATFFNLRFPSISISSVALQILVAYTGKLFRYIPDFSFPVGFGRRVHFGGGKWNFKEQMLATCGMGTGNAAPYSMYVVISMASTSFYGFKEAQGNFGFIIMLTLATNLMGFGLAGVFRIFLVYPVRLVWYFVLPGIKLSRVLVADNDVRENVNGWRLKSWEFFWIFTVAEFCWYWVTDFLFSFLSNFDWVAWIAHKNNNMLAMCGVLGGLGINPLPTLDPSVAQPSAMVTPWFATVTQMLGMFFGGFVIIGMWYMNNSYTGYLRINTNTLYDRFGKKFNVTKVLNSNKNLDVQKFHDYSLPFWSAGNIVVYGSFFAFYPAMIVYALINYTGILKYSLIIFWKTVVNPKRALHSFNDRFTRAQRKYKEVPEWWFILFLLICIGISIATVEHYKFTNTPVWTIFFGIGLSAVFMVPSGVLYATTNQQVVINVLYELVIGLTVEGNGNALMVSKAFATNFMAETDNFITNLKQAHYVGLAPRSLFRIQIVSLICNSFVQSGLMVWQSVPGNIPDMCTPQAAKTSKFTCANIQTYFNAAVQWGTIGPRRVLTDLYPGMRYTFLAGALFPIPFWIVRRILNPLARRNNWGLRKEGASAFSNNKLVLYAKSCEWINSMNELVFVSGMLMWAPNNLMYYLPYLYYGFVFQWWLPKYKPRWWAKYNYLLYAALTVGFSYSALIMFFAAQYHHVASVDWWGTTTATSLVAGPNLEVPAKGWFGPEKW